MKTVNDWEPWARTLRAQGKTWKEISEAVGVSSNFVQMRIGDNALGYSVLSMNANKKKALGLPAKGMPVADLQKWAEANKDKIKERIMSDREFTPVKKLVNGTLRTGVVISCSKKQSKDCLIAEEFVNSTGITSHVHAAQVFRNHGWIVGGGPRADICPKCMAMIVETRREKKAPVAQDKIIETTAQPSAPQPSAAAPAPANPPADPIPSSLTLKDIDKVAKRLIDEKLDEVYSADKGGYMTGYSDQWLAEDMKVPIAWVKLVRDFGHGPESFAVDIKEDMRKIETLMNEHREIKRSIDIGLDRMTELDRLLNERLAKFEKNSKEITDAFQALKAKIPNGS